MLVQAGNNNDSYETGFQTGVDDEVIKSFGESSRSFLPTCRLARLQTLNSSQDDERIRKGEVHKGCPHMPF